MQCGAVIFGHTKPTVIAKSDSELCTGILLVRRGVEPLQSLGVTLAHAITMVIAITKFNLCYIITLLCCFAEPFYCFSIIYRNPITMPVTPSKESLGIGFSLSSAPQ